MPSKDNSYKNMSVGFPCTELAGHKPIPVQELRMRCIRPWATSSACPRVSLCPGLSTGLTPTWEVHRCLASHQLGAKAKCAYPYSSGDRQTQVAAPSSWGWCFLYGKYRARRSVLPPAHSKEPTANNCLMHRDWLTEWSKGLTATSKATWKWQNLCPIKQKKCFWGEIESP